MYKKLTCLVIFVLVLSIAGVVQAREFYDDFSTPHNYLTAGVAGTGWDGFVGLGAGESVDALNADINHPGELYIESTGARWEPDWNPLGPFLYKVVYGDFTVTVKVTDFAGCPPPVVYHNDCGIMARVPELEAAGAGEDAMTVQFFATWSGNIYRIIDNGGESESGATGDGCSAAQYLQLERIGNDFYCRISDNGADWADLGPPVERSDMDGLGVQVGLWQCTYDTTTGYAAFDDFSLIYEIGMETAGDPHPADGLAGVPVDTDLSWTAGELVQDVNGHDVYFGTDEDAVTDANKTNHANVDYYNVDDPCCDPGPLQFGRRYYWRVDEVNEPNIWEGEVWNFTTTGFRAANPNPTDSASDVSIMTELSWSPGIAAASHDVYFGTDFEDVNSASIGHHPNVDYDNVDVNSYYPGVLNCNQVYFWRIDEVNEPNIWEGNIWSFTTNSEGVFGVGNEYFELQFNMSRGGFTQMLRTGDDFGTDFILGPDDYITYNKSDPGWLLGDIMVEYRIGAGSWLSASTYESDDNRQILLDYDGQRTEIMITYPLPSGEPEGIRDFDVSQRWVLDGNSLALDVNIVNTTGDVLEIGDLGFPLPFNSHYSGASTEVIQTKRVLRHGFFSGHGSHSYWTRVNGVAPFLAMTTPSPDTRFEYWDNIDSGDIYFKAYVHSLLVGNSTSGNWRQEHTSRVVSPGETVHLNFNFSWADSLNEVRNILYEDNDIDIECVPGMTIPQDLYALVKLRTKQTIDSVVAEYPADTVIQYLGESEPDTHVYKVTFNRLGENIIVVNHNGTEQTMLEFFSTEPVETLVKKRSSHMVNYEQVQNPSKWYDGLFGEWDLRYSVLRTPDNTDGMDLPWWIYVICCDDPGNSHAPYLASKNVHFPVQVEIDALEYYIDNYVWGGLQYTDTEAYPWGILGVPTWYYNRANDPAHIWRVFDYPHIVMLYYHMYQIAKYYPDMVAYLNKDGYLNRAYNTAMKYYDVADGWGYTVGTYNELVFVDVINALREEGLNSQADALEERWDQKVKYFIFDKEYPYGSEYAMDSTAFESSHALAKWAMENGLEPDPQHPVIDPERIEEFMHGQMMANLAVRGCIEPAFYTYGSDYRVWGQTRYTLSYMSQMGGWAVLDYGLNWTEQPIDYIRLGYGSYLSSWALMNTDTSGTNGYWYPGVANDGAIGWAFKPEKNGPIWLQSRYLERGIWYYNGEIDLGIGGALRTARAIVVDDPVFGLFGYGCDVTLSGGKYYVEPKDGLREWLVMQNLGLQLKLDRDAFAEGQEIAIGSTSHLISFVVENERLNAHTTKLTVSGLAAGTYVVKIDGVKQYTFSVTGPEETVLNLDIGSDATYEISINLSADIDDSGSVDFIDFAKFALYWLENGCGDCGGADLTGDGNVDWDDLKELSASWLQ